MLYFFGSKDIKDLLVRALNSVSVQGKKVLDFPCGSGFSSEYLKSRGAEVTPWDMFPEFFNVSGLQCQSADLQKTFPASDASFDMALFQEGIEHLSDQLFALKEFHRVLKPGASLFVTTPNYSNLRSRLSYFLMESETPRILPPNEVESVWFSKDSKVYFGHIFSLGIMKLRVQAVLAGFELHKIHPVRVNNSSLFLFILTYPFIFLQSFKTYLRAKKKLGSSAKPADLRVLKDVFKLNLNPTVLLGGHLLVEFKRLESPFSAKGRSEQITQT